MKLRKQKTETTERRRPVSTTQPGVFSYYSQRNNAPQMDAVQQSRHQEPVSVTKRARLRIGLIPSYIALVILVGSLLYSLWLQPLPRVHVVSEPGTVYHSNQEYEQQISRIWKSSLLNQSKLTVRSADLRTAILQQFGELADVKIDLPLLGRRPAITLVPAHPAFELVSGNGVYYVASNGRVMAQTKDVTKNELSNLVVVKDESGLQATPGKVVIPETEATFLAKLSAQLQDAKIPVQSISLPNNAANEADVHLTDQTYYIKFSIDSDARQAVGSYIAVRDKLKNDGVTPKQYIDVRVDEKVFYL